jgi:hypothetical protein
MQIGLKEGEIKTFWKRWALQLNKRVLFLLCPLFYFSIEWPKWILDGDSADYYYRSKYRWLNLLEVHFFLVLEIVSINFSIPLIFIRKNIKK